MKRDICNKIRKMSEAYFENILEAGQTSQVEAHLSECPSCRKAYGETREVLDLLKKDRLPDPGPAFWDNLNSRIMTQIRLSRPAEQESPWYKKLWVNPFGWPGYAWVTVLLLILLTPVVIYNIHMQGTKTPSIQGINGQETRWETGSMSLSTAVETLSEKESANLAKRVVAQMGKDLSSTARLLVDDETHWDVSSSIEGLNTQELEALIKKMGPEGSAVYREGKENVC